MTRKVSKMEIKAAEQVKKLKRWFGKHGWNYSGYYFESPIHHGCGFAFTDPRTGKIKEEWNKESYASFDIGRDAVYVRIHERKHLYKRDESVPDDGFWHSFVPSDEFTDWEEKGYTAIPAEDILKLAEMITARQKEYCECRGQRYNYNDFKIRKNKGDKFINRNYSYDELKRVHGNDILREKRGCVDPFEWSRKYKEEHK